MNALIKFVLASSLAITGVSGMAGEEPSVNLIIKDNRFQPAEISIKAGVKVRLLVKNLDKTPEEFESYELGREKIIPAGEEVVLYIGPLKPGRYPFFGEFHADTAKGTIIAE